MGGVHSNSSALVLPRFYEPNRSRASYQKLPPPRSSFPCPSSAVGFAGGSDCQESVCKTGNIGSIPGSERSPGEGKSNTFGYSCLGNPIDAGAWWVTRSQTVGHYLVTKQRETLCCELSQPLHTCSQGAWTGSSSQFRGTESGKNK